jgi:hypothetical protein
MKISTSGRAARALAQFPFGKVEYGFFVGVDAHEVEGRQQRRIYAGFVQVGNEKLRGDEFAFGHQFLAFLHAVRLAGQRTDEVKVFGHHGLALARPSGVPYSWPMNGLVAPVELVDGGSGGGRVALADEVADFDEAVGRARHGRQHDQFAGAVLGNEAGDGVHPFGFSN